MKIENHGNPASPIWVIAEAPYSTDVDKGYIWSGGLGHVFRKVWSLSKLPEPYIHVLKPTLGATYDETTKFSELVVLLCDNGTPFILPTSVNLFKMFCPTLSSKSQEKALLKKYSGNLLNSDSLPYSHYVIPQYDPQFIGANWNYHEIQAFIDLGHVYEEWEYWTLNNHALQPLPMRQLVTEPSYEDLLSFLYRIRYEFNSKLLFYVSVDIETIRPKKGTPLQILGHPGYPYTISLAISPSYAISFSFWDYDDTQLVKIWRELDWILTNVPIIGQNFSVFDAHFCEALGFTVNLAKFQDTLIRHHILWPGLEHKLQFQTKQYTREPYYKDEGRLWTPKDKTKLMRYNCLDTAVTYEIYLKQEEEFKEKPWLK